MTAFFIIIIIFVVVVFLFVLFFFCVCGGSLYAVAYTNFRFREGPAFGVLFGIWGRGGDGWMGERESTMKAL